MYFVGLVGQFILNLQIHYLPMPSFKHFEYLYQEEVTFESSELITAQILLGPVQNWTSHFQRWTTRKSMNSCWSMLVNGSSGKVILLTASNMGGVWEHQIRSAPSVMVALLKIHGASLNDESLHTFLAEAETIVNTRPITSEFFSDVHSPVPLWPMQLLAMKSRVVIPLPGESLKEDIYCRKQGGDMCNT